MYRRSHRPAQALRSIPKLRAAIEPLESRRLLSTFAIIGDLTEGSGSSDVSKLVKSWNPEYIVSTGDNVHGDSSIDKTIGQYYHDYVSPYSGKYGAGSSSGNRMYSALGNHDYDNGINDDLSFWNFPGNERYYNVRKNDVELFIINSNSQEPDGTSSSSKQGQWLKNALAASSATFKLVFFHYPAYTSGTQGDHPGMQWPFQQWGTTAAFSGHDHMYERLQENGFTYFVNGLGGADIVPPNRVESGSQVRYSNNYGGMLVQTSGNSINFQFISVSGSVKDNYTITVTSSGGGGGGGNGSAVIPMGSAWKYLDNGSNQGSAWRALGFDDSSWKSGAGQLGYGDGDETTVVSYGGNSSSKYITTYFRKNFNVSDASSVSALGLKLIRDDGVVVYLNGTEIFRNNMPTGTISSSTLASTGVEDDDILSSSISKSLLVSGNNVLAVEIHQADAASSDISFDFELDATGGGITVGSTPTAPSSLTASASGSSQINLNWSDNSGSESGYKIERSTDGTNFTQIATTAANATSFSDTGLASGKTYTYRVRAYNANGNSAYTNTASATTGTSSSTSLPAPWAEGDIGSVAAAGSTAYASGVFTVKASGTDIWNNADSFHFVYQKLTGDGTIVARVTSLSNTNGWAKAGVMMRESLSSGAKEASMNVSPSNGTAFIYRTSTGGASDGDFSSGAVTIWLKLVRAGNSFTAFRSTDGSSWTQVGGAQSISMASTIYVGLGVTAKSTTAINTTKFDNVTVTGQTQSALAAQATDPFSAVEITDPTKEDDLLGLLE